VVLRSAASTAGGHAAVDVAVGSDVPAEVAMTVYLCWLDALGRAGGERRAAIEVRESEGDLDFVVLVDGAHAGGRPVWLEDRVEALGGRVAITARPDGELSVSGSLPLRR